MHSKIAVIEQDFRNDWEEFDPAHYQKYLSQVPDSQRVELLTRLLSAELEFAYSPPSRLMAHLPVGSVVSASDDERVRPCVQLFAMRFPELLDSEKHLIQLIVLEFALRLQHEALPPNPESYLDLCETRSHDRLVQLLELTEDRLPGNSTRPKEPEKPIGHGDSTIKDEDSSASIPAELLPTHLGSYLLVRLIGRGGMGYVYSAVDLHSTARVAIKVMRRVDSWSVFRFFEEFRWLSQLEHPNLLKLYNAYNEGDSRYFSMELVEGHTIAKWFKNLPQNKETRWTLLRKVLSQLASAINYLHRNRVLHCDIKCSNMMITASLRAVVLDLGLSVREGQTNPLVGTIQYMAPEVLNKEPPTKSSDWYSFGVMMYEVMSGNYPPIEVDVSGDGQAVYQVDREKLQAGIADCPHDLQNLCLALLSAGTDNRPSGAYVMAVLGGDVESVEVADPAHNCPGRQRELHLLDVCLERIDRGVRRCAIVHGESGIGKSALLQHWLRSIDRKWYNIASASCYHQDQTPNRLLNALAQELMPLLSDADSEHWRPGLFERIKRIGQLFPQLEQLLGIPTKATRPSSGILPRKECLEDLMDWLCELSQWKRFVITVDNAQWADQDGIRDLMRLQNRDDFHGLIVLVNNSPDPLLSVTQKDDAFPSSQEQSLRSAQGISVGPLDRNTCSTLLVNWGSHAGISMSEMAIERLTRLSGGNPFLLRELSHAFVHNYNHATKSDSDAVNKIASDTHSTVRRRFASLSRNAELVLEYLAVANHPLGFHQLQALTRIIPQDLLRAISALRSQGWIRTRSGARDSDIEITHERFRKVIAQGIASERLRRRHMRTARVLSNDAPRQWPRIGNHYWQAGQIPEAAACYVEAAREAYSTGAIEEALFFLSRALNKDVTRSAAEQVVVERLRGDCLASIGDAQRAAQVYEALASRTTGQQRMLLRCLAGEQWIRAGQHELAISLLRDALQQMRVSRRPSTVVSMGKTLWSALRRGRSLSQEPIADLEPFTEREACLNRISSPLTFLDNSLGQELIVSVQRQARSRGTMADRAQSHNRTAVILSFLGRRGRKLAVKQMHHGRRLAHASGLDSSLATWNFCMFIWYIQKGDVKPALTHGQRSIKRFAGTRERYQWEQQFLRWGILCCFFHRGQFKDLKEATAEQRQSVSDRNDPMNLFWKNVAAAHWSDLVEDKVESARGCLDAASRAVSKNTFQLRRFFLWLSQIYQNLYEGKGQEAYNVMRSNWRQYSLTPMLRTSQYRWFALHARVCTYLLLARNNPDQRRSQFAKARKYARKMLHLQESAYIGYGRSLLLAIDAFEGKIAPHSVWQHQIQQLEHDGHSLMASALQWHYFDYLPDGDQRQQTLRNRLVGSGCARPERLLTLMIPLQSTQSD